MCERTQHTFKKWFDDLPPDIRRRTIRPVLLLMENEPVHSIGFDHNNVKVKLFPPNITSWKQPMDMGIISAVKNDTNIL